MNYFLIFVGSGLGGALRYLVSTSMHKLANTWIFPIGTLTVNLVGCLVIGFLAQLSESRAVFSPEVRLFIFVGILGGFTTFSSFGYETVQLIRDGQYFLAAANVVLQVVCGLLCVWLGYILGRFI